MKLLCAYYFMLIGCLVSGCPVLGGPEHGLWMKVAQGSGPECVFADGVQWVTLVCVQCRVYEWKSLKWVISSRSLGNWNRARYTDHR